MSLPPEHINIKRRREEEPVETLYIQDELHRTKRRFTDFVFQRVQAGGDGTTKPSPSPSPGPAAHRTLRTPRSVSSLKPRSAGGVPSVRATSPGTELREQKRVAAARREAEEKFTRALHSGPVRPDAATGVDAEAEAEAEAGVTSGRSSALSGRRDTPSPNASVRKFQISRSSTPAGLRKNLGGGVQKRRGESVPGVAVLVEKLRQPHSRKASMVSDLLTGEGAVPADKIGISLASEEERARPRKRPVVNQAEKRWREDRQNAISTAKQRIASMADASQGDSDDESARLAQQFEQVALDLESGMDTETTEKEIQPSPAKPAPVPPKPPLKYQPRVPNKARPTAAPERSVHTDDTMQVDTVDATPQAPHGPEHDNDSDGEYVYDTYIRRPLAPGGQLSNPLTDLEKDQDTWFRQRGIDTTRPDIGVIVIPAEDEQYWENFAEDDEDEDRWDSEDADSNAENNPANDYPDEELSWDDEDDDPTAIYSRYRDRAASDDEEFDIYDSASEGEDRFGY
ncbi:hypothetical protein PHISP_06211 [Aspergillus sp. HF37]|nr:hypothetical protein PHISP_06211 [Aspergillus sp. HF37]